MKTFKTLDVFLYRGHGITSKAIRFLEYVRYGIPFKDTYSHIALGYDENNTLSAEAGGTKIVPNSEIETGKSDVLIYRYNDISDEQLNLFFEMVPEYLGRGYAFARYALDAARIFSFVAFILAIIFGWMSWKLLLFFILLVVVLQVASFFLKKIDKKTSDCSELAAIFLSKLHLMPHFSSQPRNEFPNSQLCKMRMMVWYKLATLVGWWDYETKKWVENEKDN